jgi:hypothetical protein
MDTTQNNQNWDMFFFVQNYHQFKNTYVPSYLCRHKRSQAIMPPVGSFSNFFMPTGKIAPFA